MSAQNGVNKSMPGHAYVSNEAAPSPQTSPATQFNIISSNKLIGFPDGNIISWCPTMDVLTISMNRMSIWAFRLNGERIYSINNKSPIIKLDWSPDGKFFCVSGIDKLIKVHDANNGKLITSIKSSLNLPLGLINWSQVSMQIFDKYDFAQVDVLGYLPKLQYEAEACDGSNGNINGSSSATSRQPVSLNISDETPLQEQEEITSDILLSISANAVMSLTFNRLYTIDGLDLPEPYKFVAHKTNQDLFNQFFLVQDSQSELKLMKMHLKLPFQSKHHEDDNLRTRKHLIEMIGNCSKMIAIINHVKEHLEFLQEECKPFITLYDRHLSNLKDSVYASVDLTVHFPTPQESESKILNVLYDILLTNLIPVSLKDYWVNQLGERGLKKLTKMGNALYDLLRKVIYTQIITSLEKLIIILSNMEGLSKWFEHNNNNFNTSVDANTGHNKDPSSPGSSSSPPIFGLSGSQILSVIKLTQRIIKLLYEAIWAINEEQKLFNKFILWCKVEIIDKLANEDNDIESFFNNNSAQTCKTSSILNYLNEYLFRPKVLDYFRIDCSMNEVILQTEEQTGKNSKNLLHNFNDLNVNFCEGILSEFSKFFRSIVGFSNPVSLDLQPTDSLSNARFISDNDELVVSCVEASALSFIHYDTQTNAQSKWSKHFEHGDELITYELIDAHKVIILYRRANAGYKLDLLERGGTRVLKSMTFNESTYVQQPQYLAVNGKESRSIGCVLDSSKQKYIVFKL